MPPVQSPEGPKVGPTFRVGVSRGVSSFFRGSPSPTTSSSPFSRCSVSRSGPSRVPTGTEGLSGTRSGCHQQPRDRMWVTYTERVPPVGFHRSSGGPVTLHLRRDLFIPCPAPYPDLGGFLQEQKFLRGRDPGGTIVPGTGRGSHAWTGCPRGVSPFLRGPPSSVTSSNPFRRRSGPDPDTGGCQLALKGRRAATRASPAPMGPKVGPVHKVNDPSGVLPFFRGPSSPVSPSSPFCRRSGSRSGPRRVPTDTEGSSGTRPGRPQDRSDRKRFLRTEWVPPDHPWGFVVLTGPISSACIPKFPL